jgi:hypothetical protein
MDIKALRAKGGIVSQTLVKKTISWTHPLTDESGNPLDPLEETTDTFDIFVRRLAYGSVERMIKASEKDRSQTAQLVCEAVRLGDSGKESLTYDEAMNLDSQLISLFAQAVSEVNGLGKTTR